MNPPMVDGKTLMFFISSLHGWFDDVSGLPANIDLKQKTEIKTVETSCVRPLLWSPDSMFDIGFSVYL